MSAKTVCSICYLASRAGAKSEELERLSLRPSAQSGKFSRKLDKYLEVDLHRRGGLVLDVPGLVKDNPERVVYTMPVRAPHEELVQEWVEFPSLAADLATSVLERKWPDAYYNHIAVLDSTTPVLPVALYIDGFPFTKGDGAIGFYIYSLVSGHRHLCVILRKTSLCGCGCLGWCSIYQVFCVWHGRLRWVLKGLILVYNGMGSRSKPVSDWRGLVLHSQ